MSPSDARVLILRFHPYPKRHFPVKKDDALRRPDFPCAAFQPASVGLNRTFFNQLRLFPSLFDTGLQQKTSRLMWLLFKPVIRYYQSNGFHILFLTEHIG